VEPLNRVFAEAFTDRYSRDGLVGVRVPQLNSVIWRYAIEDAGAGAMVWREAGGELVAFNMVHRSGTEGWMGPLAVRPDRQNEGLGSAMVLAGIEWLKAEGARTIGLETMPRTVDNIGFYSRLGFMPGHLTVTLVRDVGRRPSEPGQLLSAAGADMAGLLEQCRALLDEIAPGTDFTRELALTHELRIGDTCLVHRDGALCGFALWHSAPLAAGRPKDEVRILKLVARTLEDFLRVVDAVQRAAHVERVRRLAIRCQSVFSEAYLRLVEQGFRVHWTDLRMMLHGYAPPPPASGIVLSNWEI
jgi:GNAT superfamily N-acetyltransferase